MKQTPIIMTIALVVFMLGFATMAHDDYGPDLMVNGQFNPGVELTGWENIVPGLEDWVSDDGYPNQGCLILNLAEGSDNGGTVSRNSDGSAGAGAPIPAADGVTQYKVSWSIKHVGGGTGLQHVRVVDNNGGCEPNPDPAGEDPCLPFSFNTHGVPDEEWAEQYIIYTPAVGATQINFGNYGGGEAWGRNMYDNIRVRLVVTQVEDIIAAHVGDPNSHHTPASGPAGADGDQGPQGKQGDAGTNGTNGSDGTAGTNGTDGATGAQGPAGAAADCVPCADVTSGAVDLACLVLGENTPTSYAETEAAALVIVNTLLISTNICEDPCDIGAGIQAAIDAKLNQ